MRAYENEMKKQVLSGNDRRKELNQMKKIIIAIAALMLAAGTCVACSQNKAAKAPETKKFTYTIINETGEDVNSVTIADDNSANKAEVKYEGSGMENGAKAEVSINAVPDKDGNPTLTASYKIDDTEYMAKVNLPEADIRLTDEEAEASAFDIAAPQK